ncbi:MAG: O-antigen ligase family protein [Nocardioidaceae bacterium]
MADLRTLAVPESDEQASGFGMRLLQIALGVVVIAAAVVSGMSVAAGDKKMVVLPLAAVVGLALAVLACTRYGAFVLLLLGVRSSVDALALSSSAGATTENAVLSRGINPSSLLAVLFLLASMLWLATRYYSGAHVRASRLSAWLVAFWLAGVVSLAGSDHVQAGLMESLRIMAVVMMFVVLEQLITSRQQMMRVLVAAYASLLIPLGYTLYGFMLGDPATEEKSGLTRILGTFSQSNAYARYLTFMIVFGVAIYPYVKGHLKTALRVLLSISGIFLLLTLTLTAILAAVVGLLLIGILTRRRALVLGFVIVIVAAVLAVPGLSSRVSTVQSEAQASGEPAGNTLLWRFNYWAEVLPLANSNPVTGIGVGSTSYETNAAKQPHNDFLRAYVETGLIGLFMYIGVLFSLVGTCRRAIRQSVRGEFDHAIAVGALACAVCVVIESMASNVITNSVALWYLMSFVAAAGYISRSSAKGSGPGLVGSSPQLVRP